MTSARDKRFRRERDAVLRSLDVKKFAKFLRDWQGLGTQQWVLPSTPIAAMHKARLQIRAFTPDEKLYSAQWLIIFGYHLPEPLRFVEDELVGAEYDTENP